jgi:hypothetical protein
LQWNREAKIPRDGSNIYSPPAGTTATPGTPIESAKYNAFVSDLTALANEARPIVAGGTGATTAAAARTALGVQASSPALTSIAALATAADKGIYTTAANTYATFDLTAAGRALLDDADAAAQRATLELGELATAADVSLAQLNAGVYASQAEAEAGTDNTKLMTPLRAREAIALLAKGAAGAPKIVGEAMNVLLPFVDVTGTTYQGWTNLDRAVWIEVLGYHTGGAIEARLSSDNGATWSAQSVVMASFTGAATGDGTDFRLLINIKTGDFRAVARVSTQANGWPHRFTSGTLAFTGSPNALQFRTASTSGAIRCDGRILVGVSP